MTLRVAQFRIPRRIGGGFQTGNSQTNAVPLMQAASPPGMIFVSLEYRLGQFGFLAGSTFAEADVSLNAGMLDQVGSIFQADALYLFIHVVFPQRAAFKWIQRYISNFGGDPK